MKRISSFIIAIITLISLTVPAFADSSDYQNPDYISDPEMAKQWNENWAEYDRLKAEKEALTNQFHKDNPGVSEYILAPSSFSSELYYDIVDDALGFRTWYTGYHGSGYYKAGGRVTVYANYSSYNAIQLLPDPKPQVTKTYLTKIAEINKKMDEVSEAAENAAIESMNQDAEMLQKITNRFWIDNDYNNHALLVFQIGNYMYAAGKANRTDFSHGHIVDNNRNAVPYITNGHTMIPIRCLIEGLGGTVDWDASLNGARCTLGNINITMPIGSEYAYVNGNPVKMTTPAVVKSGRTMIPVRFVAETLGYGVDYISDGAFVVIRKLEDSKVAGFDFTVSDFYEYTGTQFGYDMYAYDGVEIGVRCITPDNVPTSSVNITDDISELMNQRGLKIQNKFKIFQDPDGRHFYVIYEYAPMYCANYVVEITIAEQSFNEDNLDEALEFIYSALATITPVYE